MTPKKLPSGNYRVQVYSHKDQDGKKHYVSFTAPTRSECLRLAVEFQRNRDMTPAEMTLNDAFDRWLSLQEPILSPSTMREYRRLKPLFGSLLSLRVDRITSTDLQRFVSEYSIGRKAKTVKNAYGFLTSVLSTYTFKHAIIHSLRVYANSANAVLLYSDKLIGIYRVGSTRFYGKFAYAGHIKIFSNGSKHSI